MINNIPNTVENLVWKQLKINTDFHHHFKQLEPLSENEVINIIKDNNLADCQVLRILSFMSKKWACKVVTENIARKLVERKSLLDSFFTKKILSKETDLHFKDKHGKILRRTVVYCHNIPGLLEYKKIVEKTCDSE